MIANKSPSLSKSNSYKTLNQSINHNNDSEPPEKSAYKAEESRSRWKFSFENGQLVPESDVGPENLRLTLKTFPQHLAGSILYYFTRWTSIILICAFCISLITKGALYSAFTPYSFGLLIFIEASSFCIIQASTILKVRRLEQAWDDFHIRRLSSRRK